MNAQAQLQKNATEAQLARVTEIKKALVAADAKLENMPRVLNFRAFSQLVAEMSR